MDGQKRHSMCRMTSQFMALSAFDFAACDDVLSVFDAKYPRPAPLPPSSRFVFVVYGTVLCFRL